MSADPAPGLHWGIKASFLDYVSRMPDGRGTIGHGARPADGNVMVFEPAVDVTSPATLSDGDVFLAFRGDVRFAGHHGMLYVRIADPWVVIHGDEAEMTVLDPHRPDDAPRLPLVRFTPTAHPVADGGAAWTSCDVRLTAEGTALFNDVYVPGELFEPLAIFPSTTQPQGEAP